MFSAYTYEKNADKHSFQINDLDLGIVNSIRRVILSEIDVVGFYGENEPTVEIIFNNGPLHSEFLIHRIGLIPLHITEEITDNYEDGDYVFELNVENKTNEIVSITTGNFTGTYKGIELTKEELNKIFPTHPITKRKILITRLRTGEHIHIKATAIKRNGKLNASFSPVSLSNFYFIEDEKVASMHDNVLDKQRSYFKNKYGDPSRIQFEIESINALSYKYLFLKAIEIIIEKLNDIISKLQTKEIQNEKIDTYEYSYNFHINDEDDTIGNLIQSLIHNKYIRDNDIKNNYKNFKCSYVGYICPHPLINKLIIRITLENAEEPDIFYEFLSDNCKEIIKTMEEIKNQWIVFK